MAIGQAVHSDAFSAGGYMWRVNCYPCGEVEPETDKKYLSIFFELLSETGGVKAIYEAFLVDEYGLPFSQTAKRYLGMFNCNGEWGWNQFVVRSDLEEHYLEEGHFTLICAIMVVPDSPIPVPSSDIGKHFVRLLDSKDGTDVSFTIESETFDAHRVVLAARSPVFKAELLGSMAESTMSSITIHDIAPATFRVMLRFMYTDTFPGVDELGDSPDMLKHLLAAADRYALDRLKLMCAQKLWEDVSVNTVSDTLVCAETYNCLELKNKCIDFFAAEGNFKHAVLTKGFIELGQKFPSIIDELRERVGL
ncbi:hypothetical protein U9M48_038186 [Paspalum notatum var. saurae]|uniref:Uncharacterized protein n=1 Tax=Paspalum notatum var. saurae TaxID=547442 RepID=A0AAQ3XBU9_PASNO